MSIRENSSRSPLAVSIMVEQARDRHDDSLFICCGAVLWDETYLVGFLCSHHPHLSDTVLQHDGFIALIKPLMISGPYWQLSTILCHEHWSVQSLSFLVSQYQQSFLWGRPIRHRLWFCRHGLEYWRCSMDTLFISLLSLSFLGEEIAKRTESLWTSLFHNLYL
jgi:hypothetical protein